MFDSVDKNGFIRKGQFVVMSTANDKGGNPVMVPLHIEEKYSDLDIVKIASVYGKESMSVINTWFKEHLRYIDMKKANALGYAPVQFGESQVPSASNHNIITRDQIVHKYGLDMHRIAHDASTPIARLWYQGKNKKKHRGYRQYLVGYILSNSALHAVFVRNRKECFFLSINTLTMGSCRISISN